MTEIFCITRNLKLNRILITKQCFCTRKSWFYTDKENLIAISNYFISERQKLTSNIKYLRKNQYKF